MSDKQDIHKPQLQASTVQESQPARRQFLKCMAWAGTGTLFAMSGGVAYASALGGSQAESNDEKSAVADSTFNFAQISDSHIGFHKAPNEDVVGTLQQAIKRINEEPNRPDFIIHTGDLTHLSKAEQFDTVEQVMKAAKVDHVFYVPGEHDVIGDAGRAYFQRFGVDSGTGGWYSFDHKGVHFVGLVNVLNLQAGGLGSLGSEQLAWLKNDLARRSSSTPIVVFAHMPLWSIYPAWSWGTQDSGEALSYLRRFGSVTVLNGHVHQIQQLTEGHITFHTARSTAYPQPAPGVGPGPGPLVDLPAGSLQRYLGVRRVQHIKSQGDLAITDSSLA